MSPLLAKKAGVKTFCWSQHISCTEEVQSASEAKAHERILEPKGEDSSVSVRGRAL